MPRVPTSDNTPQITGGRPPFSRIPTTEIARQAQSIQQGAAAVSSVLLQAHQREVKKATHAAVIQAQTALSEQQEMLRTGDDTQLGFKSFKGQDTMNRNVPRAFLEERDVRRDKVVKDMLHSDAQRQEFLARDASLRSQFNTDLVRHMHNEQEQFYADNLESGLRRGQDDAVALREKPPEMMVKINQEVADMKRYYDDRGKSGDISDDHVTRWRSDTIRKAILGLLDEQKTFAAKDMFEDLRNAKDGDGLPMLLESDEGVINGVIGPKNMQQKARIDALELFNNRKGVNVRGPVTADALEEFNAVADKLALTDFEASDLLTAEWGKLVARQNNNWAVHQDEVFDRTVEAENNGRPYEMTPTQDVLDMSPEQNSAALSWANRIHDEVRNPPTKTNKEMIYRLRRSMEPEEFAEHNLILWSKFLSDSDFSQLDREQRMMVEAQKNGDKSGILNIRGVIERSIKFHKFNDKHAGIWDREFMRRFLVAMDNNNGQPLDDKQIIAVRDGMEFELLEGDAFFDDPVLSGLAGRDASSTFDPTDLTIEQPRIPREAFTAIQRLLTENSIPAPDDAVVELYAQFKGQVLPNTDVGNAVGRVLLSVERRLEERREKAAKDHLENRIKTATVGSSIEFSPEDWQFATEVSERMGHGTTESAVRRQALLNAADEAVLREGNALVPDTLFKWREAFSRGEGQEGARFSDQELQFFALTSMGLSDADARNIAGLPSVGGSLVNQLLRPVPQGDDIDRSQAE